MNFPAMLSGILRALWRAKARSLLMMAGVLFGVMSLTLLSSIGAATSQVTLGRFRNMLGSFDTLMIEPGAAKNRGMVTVANTDPTLSFDDASAIGRDIPSIRQVVDVLNVLDGQISYRDRHETAGVFGVSVNWPEVRQEQMQSGEFFSEADANSLASSAVLGAELKQKLFGADDPIGKTIRIGEVPFTIKGVLAPRGVGPTGKSLDNLVYIPVTTASKRLFNREYLTMAIAQLKDENQSDLATRQIKALLRTRHHLSSGSEDNFTISSPRAVMAQIDAMGSAMATMLRIIAIVAMLLGGVVIFTLMYLGVAARRAEIGLRRATGATRRAIATQFLAEAAIVSGVGALIGAILGVASAQLVGMIEKLPFIVDTPAILTTVAEAILVGLVFGSVPAWRASRIDPGLALRQ